MVDITILVIDDEPALTRSVQSYLEDYDYIVDTANSGTAGIELFRERPYDIVITDLMMPGITGQDVLKKIKELSPETPTIVASGAGRVTDVVEAIRNGAWDYLTKPIEDLDILKITVEKVLEKAHLISENQEYQKHLELLVEKRTTELNQTVKELRESRENLKITLDSIGDMVIVTDSSDKIIRINPATLKLIGLCQSAILGHSIDEIISFPEIDPNSRQKIKKTLQLAEQQVVIRNSQKSITVVGTMAPLHENGRKEPIGNVIVLSDITEERQLERQLQHAQKMESLGRLASGISHDFRNILSGITGMSELILSEIESPELQELVRAILSSAENAGSLINKMLAFSRNDDEKKVPLQLDSLVEDTVTILEHTLGSRIKITTEYNVEESPILGSRSEIQNSIINLAINARDAMNGIGKITISVDTEDVTLSVANCIPPLTVGKYVTFSLTDTGSGIPEDKLDLIFEPFFTTKESGKGTGLGLAGVYGTAKDHGGAVLVTSVVNSGTTFKLFFPYTSETVVQSETPTLTNRTALVISNDATTTILLQSILRKAEMVTTPSNSYKDGIQAFQQQLDFDIVFIDIGINTTDGLALINTIKNHNENATIIITIEEYISTTIFENSGVTLIIQKPLRVQTILEQLRTLLS